MLKITSYGLDAFREGEVVDRTDYKKYWDMLWTAPGRINDQELGG